MDYIRREMITSGELRDYVDKGLRGLTSNPSIFMKAITGGGAYDDDLEKLAANKDVKEIYESIAIQDIQMAADVLRPVYEESARADGYVSLEVDPHLAHDTAGSILEARSLFERVNRPNIYIKIPATQEGISAVKTMIAEGYNINITLMFSLDQYEAVAEAYISGLEKLAERGGDLSKVTSVASFFVSRIDVRVDEMLAELEDPKADELKGKVGIANAKMAYQRFKETFKDERWEKLSNRGAHLQRVLWASTSTKNPNYPDTLYVDNLIGPHTVNTLPPETIEAFIDHGTVALTLEKDLDEAREVLEKLADLGIDLDEVTDELLVEGVDKFAKPFDKLLQAIEEKRERMAIK
jgi:transaldolase